MTSFADPPTLSAHATDMVNIYLIDAKMHIDELFGEGYAEAHPELVGAFLQSAATCFAAQAHAKALTDGLCPALSSIDHALRGWY